MNRRTLLALAVAVGLAVLLLLRSGEPPPEPPPPPASPTAAPAASPLPPAPPPAIPPGPSGPVALRGRVVDGEGRPVAGVGLRIVETSAGAPRVPVETGADGGFLFPPAEAREWTVRLSPPEPPPGEAWTEYGPFRRVSPAAGPATLVLERRPVAGSRVKVEVVDAATGGPLTPERVLFQPRDGFPVAWTLLAAAPEAVADGLVVAAAEPGVWRAWVRLADGRVAFRDVVVEEGARETSARLAMGEPGALAGTVEGGEGTPGPAGGIEVAVGLAEGLTIPAFSAPAAGAAWSPSARVPLSPDGTFSVPNLVPGRYRVSILSGERAAAATVEVAAGETATVALRPTAPGRLRLVAEGIPPPAFAFLTTVHAEHGLEFIERRRVGADGSVTLEVPAHPGRIRWRLGFGAAAERGSLLDVAATREGEVEVAAGETAEVAVPVVPAEEPVRR